MWHIAQSSSRSECIHTPTRDRAVFSRLLSVPAPLLPPNFYAPPSLHFLVSPLPPCTRTIVELKRMQPHEATITSSASPPGQNDAASTSTADPPLAAHAASRHQERGKLDETSGIPPSPLSPYLRRLPYSLCPISIPTSSRLRFLPRSMHPNYRQTQPHTPTRSGHALGPSRHFIFRPVSGRRLLRGASPSSLRLASSESRAYDAVSSRRTPPSLFFSLSRACVSVCVSQCAPVVRVDFASSSPLLSPYLTLNHVSVLSPSASKISLFICCPLHACEDNFERRCGWQCLQGAFFAVSSAAGIVIVSVSPAICLYSYLDDMVLVSLAYRTSGCAVYCVE
ncbi:hypothetical protein BDN70DRAFT_885612 [Pholiota conissans]|uniref:Uncharacterized protein n=1 Tax=Pholiota conissans TaxID=109636 RepID=A0A9P5YTX5_9AGAR|nr:hypothetical protein BDN70DRAFT_885612 [Pholiota conissans]